MGFFKLFKNVFSSEGCREAMKMSYEKHKQLAVQKRKDENPHHIGLYGALATRYEVRGWPITEAEAWSELMPFMKMPEDVALRALTEYVLVQEKEKADEEWLRERLADVFAEYPFEEQKEIAVQADASNLLWGILLLRGILKRKREQEEG